MPNFLWPTASNPDRFPAVLSRALISLAALGLVMLGCSSSSYDDPEEVLTPGTISFPFSYEPERIGRDGRHGDKLVVKSIAGKSEYVIELPDEGDNYDIEVPTATFDGQVANPYRKFKNPSATDRELVDQMPQLSPSAYRQRQQIEAGLGLSEKGGPGQSPSYIVGLAEINQLYRQRELELALVKTNNLIIHYPNSSKLHKMKGTLLIKLRNFPLAQRAWAQAARLDPGDKLLQRGLIRLEERIKAETQQSAAPQPAPVPAPKPTSQTLPQPNPGELPVGTGESGNAVTNRGPNSLRNGAVNANGSNSANANTNANTTGNAAANAANSGGMSPRGFSDGLAPRNVPNETRNALLPTPERNGTNLDPLANSNEENAEANGNLADGSLTNGNNFAPGSGNGAAPAEDNGLGQRPPDPNNGSNLFDQDPNTAAEQKPPNVWRNNGTNPAN